MQADVLSAIRGGLDGFSKGQRRIAAFILDDYDKAAFMTASKLGASTHVSESTVVRFAAELGYDGYPEMQKALQEVVRTRLTSVQRMEVVDTQLEDDRDVVSMVLQSDMNALRMTNDSLDRSVLYAAVEEIVKAKTVYIVGARSSATIANFLNFYLRSILDNVRLIQSNSSSDMLEQAMHIKAGDVLIGVSLPRYSSRTVKVMHFAKDLGCKLIAVTDNHQAPLARISDHVLIAKSDMLSIVDSLVAPMSVANALVVAISRKLGKELSRNMNDLERIWEEYGVYESIDI